MTDGRLPSESTLSLIAFVASCIGALAGAAIGSTGVRSFAWVGVAATSVALAAVIMLYHQRGDRRPMTNGSPPRS